MKSLLNTNNCIRMDSHPQNFSSDDDDTMAGVYNAWSKCYCLVIDGYWYCAYACMLHIFNNTSLFVNIVVLPAKKLCIVILKYKSIAIDFIHILTVYGFFFLLVCIHSHDRWDVGIRKIELIRSCTWFGTTCFNTTRWDRLFTINIGRCAASFEHNWG